MTTAVPGVAPLPCGARHRFAFWLRIVPSVRTDHRCDVAVVLQAARTTAVLLPDPPPAVSRHRSAGVRIEPSDQRLNCWGGPSAGSQVFTVMRLPGAVALFGFSRQRSAAFRIWPRTGSATADGATTTETTARTAASTADAARERRV